MDESTYQHLADEAYRHISDAFEDVDPDVVDCEVAGDVLTLTFPGKRRCVLNTQRPTRQLWLAAIARAWHFNFDEQARAWRDDKGEGRELYETVRSIVKDIAGLDVTL